MSWCRCCNIYEVQAEFRNGLPVCAQCYVLDVYSNWERYDDEAHRRAVRLGIKAGLQQAIGMVDDIPKEPIKKHRLPTRSWQACRKKIRKALFDRVMEPPEPLR